MASGSSTGLNARQEQIIKVDCTGIKIIDGNHGGGGGKQDSRDNSEEENNEEGKQRRPPEPVPVSMKHVERRNQQLKSIQ